MPSKSRKLCVFFLSVLCHRRPAHLKNRGIKQEWMWIILPMNVVRNHQYGLYNASVCCQHKRLQQLQFRYQPILINEKTFFYPSFTNRNALIEVEKESERNKIFQKTTNNNNNTYVLLWMNLQWKKGNPSTAHT